MAVHPLFVPHRRVWIAKSAAPMSPGNLLEMQILRPPRALTAPEAQAVDPKRREGSLCQLRSGAWKVMKSNWQPEDPLTLKQPRQPCQSTAAAPSLEPQLPHGKARAFSWIAWVPGVPKTQRSPIHPPAGRDVAPFSFCGPTSSCSLGRQHPGNINLPGS